MRIHGGLLATKDAHERAFLAGSSISQIELGRILESLVPGDRLVLAWRKPVGGGPNFQVLKAGQLLPWVWDNVYEVAANGDLYLQWESGAVIAAQAEYARWARRALEDW